MLQVAELSKDRLFRTKLILACLSVSLFVSIIYVVVSYRLTADLGIQTEIKFMENQARLFHSELLLNDDNLAQRVNQLAKVFYVENNLSPATYIRAYNTKTDWYFSQKIPPSDLLKLQSSIADVTESKFGEIDVNERNYLWLVYRSDVFTIEVIQESSAIEETMAVVAKRLLTISVIVFWISIWLALTLSSFIAKQAQQKNDELAKLATHDTLTGLPNRLYLVKLLDRALSKDGKAKEGCLFVIDLDKFKEVNDSFGHAAGDHLLIEVAERLSKALTDEQVLVRLGGDEFIVWTPEISVNEAKLLSQELVNRCDEPVMINNLAVNTGASIGIAHYPSHACSAEMLIINADTAMYKAKQQHCGWLVFDERDSADYKNRLRLRADISRGLADGELKLYFQPKVELGSGHIIGVEALIRWHHPTDGVLPPSAFIDLIEHSGRVQEFGRYTICQAITQMATWQQQAIEIPVAVNLSPYNLLDPGLVDFISEQLVKHKVNARKLEIELTENETSLNIHHIQKRLEGLKALGITLTIDDFGTGMSSLSYIANLNVDIIKIDRAFICDLHTNPKHKAIVSTAIYLSRSFGCKLVAEGIEENGQAALLLAMGCDYGQGYLFSKPMDAMATTKMLASTNHLQRQ